MNHRKQSRRQLWPGFSCSLCWWCSQHYYTRVRLSAGSLYTKKILQMYSMLSNPLSKLKGSPSAVLRFLRGSSLTCFLSLLPASLFSFPSLKLTFITGLWQWRRLSCPGSGPAVRVTVGLFFLLVLCQRISCRHHKTAVFHRKLNRKAQGVYWSQHENWSSLIYLFTFLVLFWMNHRYVLF